MQSFNFTSIINHYIFPWKHQRLTSLATMTKMIYAIYLNIKFNTWDPKEKIVLTSSVLSEQSMGNNFTVKCEQKEKKGLDICTLHITNKV